ncbi:MAG: hypothetical protein ACKVJK_17475, partial [Methylophagaceae bacterium]
TIGTATTAVANVAVLTITANPLLATIDATNLTTLGATAASNAVNIYGNLFTIDKASDLANATATTAALGAVGKVGDLGAYTTTSGFATLKAYLGKVDANASAAAAVYVDIVTSVLTSAGAETQNDETYTVGATRVPANASIHQKVLIKSANTAAAAVNAVASKRSYLITGAGGTATDGVTIHANGTSWIAGIANAATTEAGQTLNSQALLATAPLASADAAGVTMSVARHASPSVSLKIAANGSTMENSVTTVAGSFATKVSDSFTITLEGANTTTVTNTNLTSTGSLVGALEIAWNAANSTATANKWILTSDTSPDELIFNARDLGSSQTGYTLAFSASLASATLSNVGYSITNPIDAADNAATADNIARGDDMVLTFLADTKGSLLSEIGSPWTSNAVSTAGNLSVVVSGVTISELSTTLNRSISNSGTITAALAYATDSRSDVITPQADIAAGTDDSVSYTRVGWL